jgi:nicotinamide riboside kinase
MPSDSKAVRGMLKKPIYVVGPQSTGKTTLINALIQRLDIAVPVIREVARRPMQDKGYTQEDVDSDDRERILDAERHSQCTAESGKRDS